MIIHKASQQQQINAMRKLIDKFTPRLKRAFLLAIDNVKGQVQMKALVSAIARGNISMAMAAVNVESLESFLRGANLQEGATSFFDELIISVSAGAAATMSTFPKRISANMAFDLLNPNTVRFIENYRVPLIRELTKTTREGVLEVIRSGLITGKAPTRQARQIRELIGLTKYQTKAITNFREQLETRKVLGFTRPNKRRLSAIERRQVARHMKEGGLTSKQIDSIVDRYYQSLVNRRALNIGRTEAVRSSNIGQLETWRQAKRKRLLSRNARKKWIVTPDDRLRDTHARIPGMNPQGRGIDEPFRTPLGLFINPPIETNDRCGMVLSAF
ncbi:hypothetical protein KAR91_21875 [Candidatus Pacearchaeota archaeon]|nr:hypothetical protein [Candidatus Pacearchaeota archaeon]